MIRLTDDTIVIQFFFFKHLIYLQGENGGELYSDSTSLETTLTELRPYTDYIISIVPFNKNGMGDTSNEIKVKTFSDTPSEPPLNVSVEVSSSTVINT